VKAGLDVSIFGLDYPATQFPSGAAKPLVFFRTSEQSALAFVQDGTSYVGWSHVTSLETQRANATATAGLGLRT